MEYIWLMWGDSYGNRSIVVVGGFDVDRGAEMTVVDMDINVQKSDMRGRRVPSLLLFHASRQY